MNIVYASNDGYAGHLAASMLSLFDRNRGAGEITVYIISMGISPESCAKLASIGEEYGREVRFSELSDVEKQFGYEIDTRGFDVSALGRLFVGRLLPRSAGRVLYLDCDTIVARSLAELWRTDLRGCVMGAVMEPTIYEEVKRQIGLSERDFYVNSGVLLIDLKQWRETGTEKELLEFYKKMGGSLFACDQDTLNGALKGRIFPLSPRYNFFPNYRYFRYRDLVAHAPSYGIVTEEEFAEAKRRPVIIHYAGDERPWIAGSRNHYRKAYEHYLALTPWAGTPKEEGKRLYMLAYHLMDYATVICPPFRWMISRKLGMRVIEARNPFRRQRSVSR